MNIKTLIAYLIVFYFLLIFLILLSATGSVNWKPTQDDAKYPMHLPDFSIYEDAKLKKSAFFEFLDPVVEEANREIKQERILFSYIKKQIENSKRLSARTQRQFAVLKKKYKIKKADPLEDQLRVLDLRINTVPKALVLIQAANESAWGTSRFAQEANNLFGQWCFSKGCGVVPANRVDGAKHEVQRFDNIYDSVVAYLRNINTHQAYRNLRKRRLELVKSGDEISAQHLVNELGSYSERGEDYIKDIRQMILMNNLE